MTTVQFMVDNLGHHQACITRSDGSDYQIVQIAENVYFDVQPWTRISPFTFANTWRLEHRFLGPWDAPHFKKMILDFVSFIGCDEAVVQHA